MKAPTMSPYLTIIPDRSPAKKAHESLGQAHKAIIYRARERNGVPVKCFLYKWADDKGWETVHEIPAGTRKEDLPWLKKPES